MKLSLVNSSPIRCGDTGHTFEVFGDNFSFGRDIAWYLNDDPSGVADVGLIDLFSDSGLINTWWNWSTIAESDIFSQPGASDNHATWLLYKDVSPVSPVPVPAAIWLFGTGLLGLAGFSKRRKAA